MKITARCHPLLEPILPKPIPASNCLPDWLKQMPGKAVSQTLGGNEIRTLKHCPPIVDAFSLGLLLPLPTDLHVNDGNLSWEWNPPIIEDAPVTRSPIGVHVPEQAEGSPIGDGQHLIIKFTNFWALEAEEGWSLLFTHPLNRPDLPFQTFSGIVDCDQYNLGYVHFPALLKPDFEGTIAKGTPVVQIIPVRRQEVDLTLNNLDTQQIAESGLLQERLAEDPGLYRKQYRRK